MATTTTALYLDSVIDVPIEGYSKIETVFLAYLAKYVNPPSYDLEKAAEHFRYDYTKSRELVKLFLKKGAAKKTGQGYYHNYYYYSLSSDSIIDKVIQYVFEKQDRFGKLDYALTQISYGSYTRSDTSNRWIIYKALSTKDEKKAQKFFDDLPKRSGYYTDFLCDLLLNGGGIYEKVFKLIRKGYLSLLLCTAMRKSLFEEETGEKLFSRFRWALNESCDSEQDDKYYLQDQIATYEYLTIGKPFPESWVSRKVHSSWSAGSVAVSYLYEGDVEEALSYFQLALKKHNALTDGPKNVFEDILLNYALILAYKKANTPETRKKVEIFRKKELTPYSHLGYFMTEWAGKELDSKSSKKHLEDLRSKLGAKSFADNVISMFNCYFDASQNLDKTSKIAMLRYEMSPWFSPIDFDDLHLTFGGKPLLYSIRVKPDWEIQLEKIREALPKPKEEVSSDMPDRRLIYVISTDGFVELMEQKLKKNGEWGTGKNISVPKLRAGEGPKLDEMDMRILNSLSPYEKFSYVRLSDIARHLCGSDRVFRLRRTAAGPEMEHVTFEEEKPMIQTSSGDGVYKVTTNAIKDYWGFSTGYTKISDIHYKVIPLTEEQSRILSLIFKDKTVEFPKEAGGDLEKTLVLLGNIFDVNSDLLQGGTTLQKAEGNSTIILRLTQKKDLFMLETFTRPLPEGKKIFFPGSGSKTYTDESKEGRFQVSRDLSLEKQNLSELVSFLEQNMENIDEKMLHEPVEMEPWEVLDIMDFISGSADKYAVEWKEGRKLDLKSSLDQKDIHINLSSKEKWFEMEGTVDLGKGMSIDLAELLIAMSSSSIGGNYIQLGEDQFIKLTESLRRQLQKIEAISLQSKGKGSEKISVFQAGQLAEIVHSSEMDLNMDKGIRTLMDKIEKSQTMNVEVPSGLNATLRDYQLEGYRWLARLDSWGGGGCLADDMGLGKTVQTIAFLLLKKDLGASLVVAPASVLLNWVRELEKFAPSLNAMVLNTAPDRAALVNEAGASDVVLCTYGILNTEGEKLQSRSWNVVCLDEAHIIKNRDTKMSSAAMKLKGDSRVILTGTPIQNYLGELWNLFQFLNPGLLGSYENFRSKFILPIESGGNKERQKMLKRVIQPFMLRRTKAEVIEELPDKTEINREVIFTTEEMAMYEKMREEAAALLASEDKVSVNALAFITKLRMSACSMSLVNDKWVGGQSKITAFLDLATEITSGGNRALVFSQFTSFLSMCREALDKTGIEYFYLDGATPIKKREEMVRAFQNGERPLFLISLKAGGLGLNLTGANYVIHLDPWWNPAIESQATDRAYRIGQRQNVTVYRLLSSHTIEEKILRLHKTKRDMAESLLEGTNMTHSLTLEDLKDLVQ